MRPDDGMLVAALRHQGEDVLAQRPDPWTGCPLLHPWANRLSAERFEVRGDGLGWAPWRMRFEIRVG